MEKKTLQVVPGTESGPEASNLDPFAPENLRLDPSTTEGAAVEEVALHHPGEKSGRQVFFRVHPEFREMFPIIDFRDDREEYIVVKELVPELATEIVHKQLCLAITRQGTLFFLPLRLPGADGKDMGWWKSLREHAKRAETHWIRVYANHELGAYEVLEARRQVERTGMAIAGRIPLLGSRQNRVPGLPDHGSQPPRR